MCGCEMCVLCIHSVTASRGHDKVVARVMRRVVTLTCDVVSKDASTCEEDMNIHVALLRIRSDRVRTYCEKIHL